jgi:hypothetical protein
MQEELDRAATQFTIPSASAPVASLDFREQTR